MADGMSPRVKVLFGLLPLLMMLLNLGVPASFVLTGEGAFFAPTWVTTTLGAGLIMFALMVWIPGSAPGTVRGALGLVVLLLVPVVLLLVPVVCNWTAFVPGVRSTSEVNLGADGGGSCGRSNRLRPGYTRHRRAPDLFPI